MTPAEQELFDIFIGFASLRSVALLKWSCRSPVTVIHEFLLNSVLLNSHFLSYPPSAQYQRAFWKWAIENLECMLRDPEAEVDDFEIDQRLYQRYLELLPSSGPSIGSSSPEERNQICGHGLPLTQQPPSDSFVTHYWQPNSLESLDSCYNADENLLVNSCNRKATLLESQRMVESGTTGLRTWKASFVLAEYLARNPNLIATRRVLELGSGVGFLGIVIASLQLEHSKLSGGVEIGSLYLTDVNEEVLLRCQKNLLLSCNISSTHPNILVETLDWFASLDDDQRSPLISHLENDIRPDIVLGADIIFDPSLIPALIGVLKIALSSMQSRDDDSYGCECALITLTLRNQATIDAFVTGIRNASLWIAEIWTSAGKIGSDGAPPHREDVYLFRITRQ